MSDGCDRIGRATSDPVLYDGQDARAALAQMIGSFAAADARDRMRRACEAAQRARYSKGG